MVLGSIQKSNALDPIWIITNCEFSITHATKTGKSISVMPYIMSLPPGKVILIDNQNKKFKIRRSDSKPYCAKTDPFITIAFLQPT